MQKVWAFYENELIAYVEKIENATPDEIKAASDLYGNKPLPEILTISGDKAQIKIHGPLSQKGPPPIARFFGFGGTGYLQIIEAINQIPESVKKVELLMDTPGGAVLGVDNVWQAVKAISEKKEVIAINQGMIASAGYWIASAAKKIISESPVNLTGSIGVLIIAIDTKKWEERIGIRVVTVVSRNAPKKAPDVSKKSGITTLQETADALERVFMGRIAEGRNLPLEHIQKYYGRGNVLVSLDPDGTDAIDVKMIDEVITEKHGEKNIIITKNELLHAVQRLVENDPDEFINGIPSSIIGIDPLGPFANEHAARLLSPDIAKIRVRRTAGSGKGAVQGVKIPESIDIIWFIQKIEGKDVPRAQSLRFPTSNWTESEAREWVKDKKIKTILFEPAKKAKSENSNTPAHAGNNKQEVDMPTTLKDFLLENPAAQVEYYKTLDEKYDAGVEAGKTAIQGIVTKLAPFLESEKYDAAIRSTVIKALKGEISPDAVIATIALDDARKEKAKSEEAKKETNEIGDTPGQQQDAGGNSDGTIKTEADFQAEVKRFKGVK